LLGQAFARKRTGPDAPLSVQAREPLSPSTPAGHLSRTDR